jgi:SAM-dependent methyltransferase
MTLRNALVTVNPTRLTMGLIVLTGLLVFPPLAYLAGAMMIFAGLTGFCPLERLFAAVSLGTPGACGLAAQPRATEPAPSELQKMSPEEIKQAVAAKYSQVALTPQADFNFPVGRPFAESVGYSRETLDNLPASMWESFTGAGNPQPYVEVKPGETLLDLGCGAGLDLYLYAKAVGEAGKAYGLDISSAMIEKARKNLQDVGIHNVELLVAPADRIPLPDGSVDVVTANGIYNLSPDKEAVMKEVYRVLKPGGRTVFAEIVLKAPLPEEIRKDLRDWFRCIGGALPEADFLTRLRAAGFGDVEVLWKGRNARTGHKLAVCAVIRARKTSPAVLQGCKQI